MASPRVPRITGPWAPLYTPQIRASYVNDHSLVRDRQSGLWHLFGITHETPGVPPAHERYFTHGCGPSLLSADGWKDQGVVCDWGATAWAPALVDDGQRYHMFYSPSPLKLATSFELGHWMEHPLQLKNCPPDACHRDPMVLKGPRGTWLMYVTGLNDQGLSQVSVLESEDLLQWDFKGFAFRTHADAPLHPAWGATESPFVVQVFGAWYLFLTYTDSTVGNYHDTLVFRSDDPMNFGDYPATQPLAKLHAHAPEILQDPASGQWLITTCGWRGMQTPVEGGVAVAKLGWV